METPVDLTSLREMTDGDPEMEEALFQEFFSSFEQGIQTLQTHRTENVMDIWRSQAHALKGIALNLGASRLGELCKQAQENNQSPTELKETLLDQMIEEYKRVHSYLYNLTSQ